MVDFVHGFAIAEGTRLPGRPFDGRELPEHPEAGVADGLPVASRVFGALTRAGTRYSSFPPAQQYRP